MVKLLLLARWDYQVNIDTPDKVRITCTVRTLRSPFLLKKAFTLYRNRADLQINEVVVNESEQQMEVVWGHHPAYGWPFLDDSCVIDLPPCPGEDYLEAPGQRQEAGGRGATPLQGNLAEIQPSQRCRRGSFENSWTCSRSHDIAFVSGFEEGWYALRSQSQAVGIGLSWDAKIFPWIWYCKVFEGRPTVHLGKEYFISLEVATSMGVKFSDAVSNGTARVITGGASVNSEIWACVFEGNEPVTRVSGRVVEF